MRREGGAVERGKKRTSRALIMPDWRLEMGGNGGTCEEINQDRLVPPAHTVASNRSSISLHLTGLSMTPSAPARINVSISSSPVTPKMGYL